MMYPLYEMDYQISEGKFQRTSTPLPFARVEDDLDNSYISCVTKLEEYPKRFRIYGAFEDLQGILCGNLVMGMVTDKQERNVGEISCISSKNQKRAPEFYRVRKPGSNKDCINAFRTCKCRLLSGL